MIQGVMFLFVMALLLFGFTKAFGGNIMRLLVSSESIYEGTMEFLDWRIYGFFFSFINVMFRALYIGITRTKVLTINAIVMALTNVVLDYALIFGKFGLPEMGIKGAAIASVLAEASSILFFVIYTYLTVDLKKYGLNRLRTFDPALLAEPAKPFRRRGRRAEAERAKGRGAKLCDGRGVRQNERRRGRAGAVLHRRRHDHDGR